MHMRRGAAFFAAFAMLMFLFSSCNACENDGHAAKLILHPKTKELTLGLGASAVAHLAVEVQPSDAETDFTWKSSKPNVATVDEKGFVEALTVGSTQIIVTENNSGKKAICQLKIFSMPQSIELNKLSMELKAGRSYSLKAKFEPSMNIASPNKALTWASSDSKIVSVDGRGKITAVSKGKVTISATTVNGLVSSCEVTAK